MHGPPRARRDRAGRESRSAMTTALGRDLKRMPAIVATGGVFALGLGLGGLLPGLGAAGPGASLALGALGVAAMVAAALAGRRPPAATGGAASAGTPSPRDAALEAAGVGVWDFDLETRTLRCDARARALFGLPDRASHPEADWLGRLHAEDRDRALDGARALLRARTADPAEYRVRLPDGGTRWVEDIAVACHPPEAPRRLVGVVRDRAEARDAARGRRAGDGRAVAEQNARFLAMMSHEIRTPMTSILGMLELLIAEPDSQRRGEHLAIARSSARSLLTILNDVLAFSRLEVGAVRLATEPARPRRLVSELIDLLTPEAEAKGLTLGWTIAPEVPDWVVADPGRLRQVLLNLLSNAIKFTDEGAVRARVDLRAASEPGRVLLRFEVQDSGIGIAPELLAQVFESFVREETPDREGTGLGLAIARQLVELMGGAITLRSTPGIGTVATFDVPVEPLAAAPRAPGKAEPPPAAPMRILVAEDNATNRYLVRALLEREGHEVTAVSDGAAAVAAAAGGAFDVILMDVQMPVMDGATAARALRAAGGPAAEVPIIALTANALSGDRSICLAAGMNDYVSKPIEIAALNAALTRAAGARKAPLPEPGPRLVSG
ncbi:MAG: hybrid sensor histidine kinase/response regulator [Rhodovulum sulfidophilum]|uniref:histidine kinase n=1 Tax=Rhodovulum sulfidophilum TaxID=35806 RepID=A0A2W5N281_RHOSU|nr:MAG: hybrid sensor histidine kinase/response regulator [Rhodovulum sulfidophilum]